ncbi:MAG: type II secretion system minor pseudopilin GspI [Gammaproteobacteria bacterium]|nr:type II secretion system minor pseudopilin GspI [Gammaproteobacteria bacterium]
MNKGFTLLEVLVALTVLAIALAAIIKNAGDNAENAAYLRDKTLAHWVAMNKLTELRVHGAWPTLGRSDGSAGMGDREWHWLLNVSETPDKELRRLEIQVSNSREADEPLAILAGFISLP